MIELSIDQLGLFLIVFIFVAATWNAAIGPGGGVTFATLAAVLSPGVAIPIHAVVEGVAGAARGWILRDLIDRRFLKYFMIGGVPGFGAGLLLLSRVTVDGPIIRSAVGLFIVATAWLPLRARKAVGGRSQFRLGAVTAILGLFVGGMQVLVAISLRGGGVEQRSVVATSTAAVLFQFSVKLVIFGLAGFSFATYGGLLVVLTAASLAGTWFGSRLSLDLLPQEAVSHLFRLVVTMIGCFILGQSLPQALQMLPVVAVPTAGRSVTLAVLVMVAVVLGLLGRSLLAAGSSERPVAAILPQHGSSDRQLSAGTETWINPQTPGTLSCPAGPFGSPSPTARLSTLVEEPVLRGARPEPPCP